MTGSEGTPERRRHRATTFVSKNNDEADAEILDRVFDTAESVVIDQIAGGADDKEVANVLIEDDLGRFPRAALRPVWPRCLCYWQTARCPSPAELLPNPLSLSVLSTHRRTPSC